MTTPLLSEYEKQPGFITIFSCYAGRGGCLNLDLVSTPSFSSRRWRIHLSNVMLSYVFGASLQQVLWWSVLRNPVWSLRTKSRLQGRYLRIALGRSWWTRMEPWDVLMFRILTGLGVVGKWLLVRPMWVKPFPESTGKVRALCKQVLPLVLPSIHCRGFLVPAVAENLFLYFFSPRVLVVC